jgi:hypothetical protein
MANESLKKQDKSNTRLSDCDLRRMTMLNNIPDVEVLKSAVNEDKAYHFN